MALEVKKLGVKFWFKVPEVLVTLDLFADPEARVRRFHSDVGKLPGITSQESGQLAVGQEVLVARLVSQGVVYASYCPAKSEVNPGLLVSALITIAVYDLGVPVSRSVSTIADGLREPGVPRAVVTVDYPSGSALVTGSEYSVRNSTRFSQVVRNAQVAMPMPESGKVAVFEISSTFLDDWVNFTEILNGIVRSVTFTDPVSSTNISAILDGGK